MAHYVNNLHIPRLQLGFRTLNAENVTHSEKPKNTHYNKKYWKNL